MEKVYGKEAFVALVEIENGDREATNQEFTYVKRQCQSFMLWLMKQGNTKEEAINICKNIVTSTLRLLKEDTYNDFLWSRTDGGSAAEIDLTIEDNPEAALAEEFLCYEKGWKDINDEKSIPKTNRIGSMGYTPQHWNLIENYVERISKIIKHFEGFNELTIEHIKTLKKTKEYVRKLRFGISTTLPEEGSLHAWKRKKIRSVHGDGIYIPTTQWKELTNRIVELLGEGKKYEIVKTTPINNEAIGNPDDVMNSNPVYGFDFERM